MTETEKKALALLNETCAEMGLDKVRSLELDMPGERALLRAIEQHEAYKQEVSDAVETLVDMPRCDPDEVDLVAERLGRFIIAKPDPVKMLFDYFETTENFYPPEFEGDIRAALAARGLEIREKQP